MQQTFTTLWQAMDFVIERAGAPLGAPEIRDQVVNERLWDKLSPTKTKATLLRQIHRRVEEKPDLFYKTSSKRIGLVRMRMVDPNVYLQLRNLKDRVSIIERHLSGLLTKDQAQSLLREVEYLKDETGSLDDLQQHTERRLDKTRQTIAQIDLESQIERLDYLEKIVVAVAGVVVNQLGTSYHTTENITIGNHIRNLFSEYDSAKQKRLTDSQS